MSTSLASNLAQPGMSTTGSRPRRSSTIRRLSQWILSTWTGTPAKEHVSELDDPPVAPQHCQEGDGVDRADTNNSRRRNNRHLYDITEIAPLAGQPISTNASSSASCTVRRSEDVIGQPAPLLIEAQASQMGHPCLTCQDWTRCDRVYPRCGHCQFEQVMCFYSSNNSSILLKRSNTTGARSVKTKAKTKKRRATIHPVPLTQELCERDELEAALG